MHAHRLLKKLVPYWTFYSARGTLSRVPLFLWKKLWRFRGFFVEKPWRKCVDIVEDLWLWRKYGESMEILCASDGKAMEL